MRHARQARLAGVGAEGQARIGRASVDVGLNGFAADVAARYLAGAGVACVRVRASELGAGVRAIDPAVRLEIEPSLGDAPVDSLDSLDLDDAAARDLARGALCALRALRVILREPS
jgi:hypothetical protein